MHATWYMYIFTEVQFTYVAVANAESSILSSVAVLIGSISPEDIIEYSSFHEHHSNQSFITFLI